MFGFIITFIVTLFIRWNAEDVITSAAIGAVGGLVIAILLWYLERRFPDQTPPPQQ